MSFIMLPKSPLTSEPPSELVPLAKVMVVAVPWFVAVPALLVTVAAVPSVPAPVPPR